MTPSLFQVFTQNVVDLVLAQFSLRSVAVFFAVESVPHVDGSLLLRLHQEQAGVSFVVVVYLTQTF